MQRDIYNDLISWKTGPDNIPFVITGARQTGKTWVAREFASKEFKQSVYINFTSNKRMITLFANEKNIDRLIFALEINSGHQIEKEKTLIILDEIQEIQGITPFIKAFNESMKKYRLICLTCLNEEIVKSSLENNLGTAEVHTLHPLSFKEFLRATGSVNLAKLLESQDPSLTITFDRELTDMLKQYCYIGGMPEVVSNFITNKDYSEVRNVQKKIIDSYEYYITRNAPSSLIRKILDIWEIIPTQLTKSSKKFVYGDLGETARSRLYDTAIDWLVSHNFAKKVTRITPDPNSDQLKSDSRAFKLFLHDTGLLSCNLNLRRRILIDDNNIFTDNNGAIIEQYALTALLQVKNISIHFYTNLRNAGEINFVIKNNQDFIPLEVTAQVNSMAKNLQIFKQRYSPNSTYVCAVDFKNYTQEFIPIPLHSLSNIKIE